MSSQRCSRPHKREQIDSISERASSKKSFDWTELSCCVWGSHTNRSKISKLYNTIKRTSHKSWMGPCKKVLLHLGCLKPVEDSGTRLLFCQRFRPILSPQHVNPYSPVRRLFSAAAPLPHPLSIKISQSLKWCLQTALPVQHSKNTKTSSKCNTFAQKMTFEGPNHS